MGDGQVSRRAFLAGSGAFAGTSLMRVGLSGILAVAGTACTARDKGAAFEVLAAGEAKEFEAIAARILPTTDTPGAREAGVIWFMDKSLGSIMQNQLAFARDGLAAFQSGVSAEFPGAKLFSDLDSEEQDQYLGTHESSGFFGLMHFMTIAGFFAMSSYGGNRDDIGWKLLGIDHQHHAWQPPFGYYDAEYLRSHSNGD